MGSNKEKEKEKEKGDEKACAAKWKPPRPKKLCFSFAAYANNLLNRLKLSNVVIDKGLSETELANLEAKFKFTFPQDLRAILQQGLPISQGFPNWRSSSKQQLQIFLNLPASSILRRVAKTGFWHPSWGPLPPNPTRFIKHLLNDAPRLVPIYRHCYIPSSPDAVGNPVFYVDHDGDVRLLSFDVAGFFREFLAREPEEPVWAATTAKRVKFWSDVAEVRGGRWWWDDGGAKGVVGGCLEKVVWRLREGGWNEDEIREMMTVEEQEEDEETQNENEKKKKQKQQELLKLKDKEAMTRHLRVLSSVLLRAGWSREDVVYSLGVGADEVVSRSEFHPQH